MRPFCALAAILVVLSATAASATPYASDGFAITVGEDAPGLLRRYQVPSADVTVVTFVVRPELWTKTFGDTGEGDLYEVASISKTATALAVLSLVDDRKVDLDEAINTYLSRWQVRSSKYDASKVTPRTVLNHTAGFPFGYLQDDDIRPERYPKLEDILDEEVGGLPAAELKREPGTKFEYSNPGYGVLELLIEEVTKKPYTEAMRDLVFKPLGMRDSGFQDDASLVRRTVPGFFKTGKPAGPYLRLPRAAGGMMSTSHDVALMLQAASVPKSKGGLLTTRTLREMTKLTKASTGAFGLGPDAGYGLGIATGKLPSGRTFIANNGSNQNSNALILGVPEKRSAITVVTNSATGIGVELELALKWFDEVIGEKPAFASGFQTSRQGMRWGTLLLVALLLAFLVRSVLLLRQGRRARPEHLPVRALLLKTIPLVALAVALSVLFQTGVVTAMLGGIPPARFVSTDYQWVVFALSLALTTIGVFATAAPKRRTAP